MAPGLSGGKRIIAGPLLAKKARLGVGYYDIRKISACSYKILLKTGYKGRRGVAVLRPPEKKVMASMAMAREREFFNADRVKVYACRNWKKRISDHGIPSAMTEAECTDLVPVDIMQRFHCRKGRLQIEYQTMCGYRFRPGKDTGCVPVR